MAGRSQAQRSSRRRAPTPDAEGGRDAGAPRAPSDEPAQDAGAAPGETDDVMTERTRKIFTLRKQIESGEYAVDAERIARRLVDDL